jgi:hypothetical protein
VLPQPAVCQEEASEDMEVDGPEAGERLACGRMAPTCAPHQAPCMCDSPLAPRPAACPGRPAPGAAQPLPGARSLGARPQLARRPPPLTTQRPSVTPRRCGGRGQAIQEVALTGRAAQPRAAGEGARPVQHATGLRAGPHPHRLPGAASGGCPRSALSRSSPVLGCCWVLLAPARTVAGALAAAGSAHRAHHGQRIHVGVCLAVTLQICANCGTDECPQWRANKGSGLIECNACSIYYTSHKTARCALTAALSAPAAATAAQTWGWSCCAADRLQLPLAAHDPGLLLLLQADGAHRPAPGSDSSQGRCCSSRRRCQPASRAAVPGLPGGHGPTHESAAGQPTEPCCREARGRVPAGGAHRQAAAQGALPCWRLWGQRVCGILVASCLGRLPLPLCPSPSHSQLCLLLCHLPAPLPSRAGRCLAGGPSLAGPSCSPATATDPALPACCCVAGEPALHARAVGHGGRLHAHQASEELHPAPAALRQRRLHRRRVRRQQLWQLRRHGQRECWGCHPGCCCMLHVPCCMLSAGVCLKSRRTTVACSASIVSRTCSSPAAWLPCSSCVLTPPVLRAARRRALHPRKHAVCDRRHRWAQSPTKSLQHGMKGAC